MKKGIDRLGRLGIAMGCLGIVAGGSAAGIRYAVEPTTRFIDISYAVPSDGGEEVVVLCSWSVAGRDDWHPAKVHPLLSETALYLVREAEWREWTEQGKVLERRAAGLERTVVFNPYPEAQSGGKVDVDFRIVVQSPEGRVLSTEQAPVHADNSDVVYLEDWSKVFQEGVPSDSADPAPGEWAYRTSQGASEQVTRGDDLYGSADPRIPLPQLSYPLDLKGWYAVHVCTSPSKGGIGVRLSGDERTDYVGSRYPFQEVFWDWRRMDHQHLVLRQQHIYTGWAPAHVDYVKLVPLGEDQVADLKDRYEGKSDKFIAGYYEPYSWAFYENVQHTLQHREPLTAFREARLSLVDIQIGRFGDKVVYESRLTDPLNYSTIGDPIGDVRVPTTDNVGRMQQFTNALDATLRYSRELGLIPHANFGASNCYPGTPLQSDFSKQHTEWMRGACLRFEVPQIREYALSLYREALEIGAPGISIDFCRYPESIDNVTTCNTLLSEMHALCNEFVSTRGNTVPILVRFPGKGVRSWENYDYRRWAREGWVDYFAPSNIQGRHHHIEMKPYLEGVSGTRCKLLPCVDALSWGPDMPDPFLWRVKQLYDLGVEGLYIYQADNRLIYARPSDRRTMRMLASGVAVNAWWEEDKHMRPRRSKGIFLSYPEQIDGYHGWERLRPWAEGVELGPMEMYLDDKLVTQLESPPYSLGSEDYSDDGVLPSGEHELRVRVKDGEGWLEQTFKVTGGR